MRFDPPALAAMSRVFARDAALKVASDGLRWLHGGGPGVDPGVERRLGLAEVLAAQRGLIDDMDTVADALYGRAS
jgi:hypothetical protein